MNSKLRSTSAAAVGIALVGSLAAACGGGTIGGGTIGGGTIGGGGPSVYGGDGGRFAKSADCTWEADSDAASAFAGVTPTAGGECTFDDQTVVSVTIFKSKSDESKAIAVASTLAQAFIPKGKSMWIASGNGWLASSNDMDTGTSKADAQRVVKAVGGKLTEIKGTADADSGS